MIARLWTGVVRLGDADAYADYIRDTGLEAYTRTPGNRGAWMLRRDEGDRTEYITLSFWEDEDAIRAFAGDDIEAAVYYPEDDRYLLERGPKVRHYVVTHEVPPAEAGSGR